MVKHLIETKDSLVQNAHSKMPVCHTIEKLRTARDVVIYLMGHQKVSLHLTRPQKSNFTQWGHTVGPRTLSSLIEQNIWLQGLLPRSHCKTGSTTLEEGLLH
jgi:hypothetical protein